MQINVGWADLKNFASSRNISVQWIALNEKYYLWAIDSPMEISAQIPILDPVPEGSDQEDFENNFKANGNQSPMSQVVTQFEKRDKTLKLCKGSAEVGEDGTATVLLKVPGVPGSNDGRWISRGVAFFDEHSPGDAIVGVYFIDHDNILGYGIDFIVGSYTEDELDEANKGWWIQPNGFVIAESLGGYGFGPAGLYMQLIGKKGSGTTGTLRVNLEWGKSE